MSSFGLQIDNLAVRKGYKALNLIAKGNSQKSGNLTAFSFTAPQGARPVIFIKPVKTGEGTAPHVLYKKDNTHWIAYFVGYVTAYVFTETHASAKGGYGIEIYNDNGEIFYDSETVPAKPLKTVTVGSVAPNTRSNSIAFPNTADVAYNLHGNRMTLGIDFGSKMLSGWRDLVVRESRGYYIESKRLLHRRAKSGETYKDYLRMLGNISNTFPVSMSFIDVRKL